MPEDPRARDAVDVSRVVPAADRESLAVCGESAAIHEGWTATLARDSKLVFRNVASNDWGSCVTYPRGVYVVVCSSWSDDVLYTFRYMP